MSKEIEAQVEAILAKAEVKVHIEYRGERRGALGGKQTMDEWLVCIYAPGSSSFFEEFPYYTGLGLSERSSISRAASRLYTPGTIAHARCLANSRPVQPHAASVLHCLILVSSAEMLSFDQWCEEFGFSNDSRQAERTFDQCREQTRKLRRVINPDVFEQLREALQDY